MLSNEFFYDYAMKFRYVNEVCRKWAEDMREQGIGEFLHGDTLTPDALMGVACFLLGYASCEYPCKRTFELVEKCVLSKSGEDFYVYEKILESSSQEANKDYFTQPEKVMFSIVLDSMRSIVQGDAITAEMFEKLEIAEGFECMSYLLEDCAELICYALDADFEDGVPLIVDYCTGFYKETMTSADVYDYMVRSEAKN